MTLLAQDYRQVRASMLQRIAVAADDGLSDAELLELMLPAISGQADAGAVRATRLLLAFGTLAGVVHADRAALLAIESMDAGAADRLDALCLFTQRVFRSKLARPVIADWAALMDYLRVAMGHARVEEFRVLFLDHSHAMLADEVLHRGTVNHTPVYPREIIKRALELGAASLILVHNHPCGDPMPSPADITITGQMATVAQGLGILVLDHVIVTADAVYSMREHDLMAPVTGDAVASQTADRPTPSPVIPPATH